MFYHICGEAAAVGVDELELSEEDGGVDIRKHKGSGWSLLRLLGSGKHCSEHLTPAWQTQRMQDQCRSSRGQHQQIHVQYVT